MAIISTRPPGLKSRVIVTFNLNPAPYSLLSFSNSAKPLSQAIYGMFVPEVFGRNDILIGTHIFETAQNYANYVEDRFNFQNDYEITVQDDVVIIEVRPTGDDCVIFTEEIFNSSVTLEFEHEDCDTPLLTHISSTYGEAVSPCSDVQVSILTSNLLVKVTEPVDINPNAANPLILDIPRGQTTEVRGVDQYDQVFQKDYIAPPVLDITQIVISQEKEFEQAILTVNGEFTGLTLEYKLDAGNWQNLNIFYVPLGATYTVYIRDQYGCQVEQDVVVDKHIPSIPTIVQRKRCGGLHELNKGKFLNLCGKQHTMKIGFVCNDQPNTVKIFKHIQMILDTEYAIKMVCVKTSQDQERFIPGDHMVYRIRESMHSVPLKNPNDWDDLRGSWAYLELEIESINNKAVDLFSVITHLRHSVI